MKKISFTVTNDLTYDQRMQRICTSLSQAGYLVTLIGRRLPNSKPLAMYSFNQKRLFCFFTKGKLFYLEYNLRLFVFLLFNRVDILGAVDLDTILPNLIVARMRRKKIVYDAHEYFTEVPEVVNRPKIKKFWEWVEQYSIPKCDVCYTVSEQLAKLFKGKYQKNFELIRNLPLLETSNNISSYNSLPNQILITLPEPLKIILLDKEKFILYQGALNMGRGIEELMYAVKELPTKVVLVGEGDESNYLRTICAKLTWQDKIIFAGYLPPSTLKMITPFAYLGYNVLENKGLSYYYSLSNKFFDYIMAQVPSINSPFPEYIALLNKHNIGVTSELSAEAISTAISNLLSNDALYNKLKYNCLPASKELNWQNEELKLIQSYARL